MPKTFLICFLFAVTLLSAASAPFQYPDGCRVDSHSDDGRTWRESVTVKGKYADIKKTIAVNLKKAGYRIKHDIPLSETPPSSLMAWEKAGKTLVVMVFESSETEVCFTWGYFE